MCKNSRNTKEHVSQLASKCAVFLEKNQVVFVSYGTYNFINEANFTVTKGRRKVATAKTDGSIENA